MLVYGNLERAALDLLSADPSTSGDKFTARIWFNTATSLFKYWDATAIRVLVTRDSTETLTNKTLTGNTAVNLISGSGTLTLNTSGTAVVPNASDTLVGKATTDTFTNKTFDAEGSGNSLSNVKDSNIKAAAAIALSKLAAVTASRALVSDGSGFVAAAAATTTTEIGYVNGVTSAIQTQLDTKQLRSTLTTKGDLYVATASNVVARQGIGSDGQVLTADSAQTNGLKWSTPSGAPDQSYEISNLTLTATVSANALTIAVKDKSGSDCSAGSSAKIGFRNATLTTGTYNQRSISAALSMVVSSGSTLGHASGYTHYVYIYAIDNAGTVELAVSTLAFDDGSIQSTTAEGGAGGADTNNILYSTTSRANVPIRMIGRITVNEATAGTWASAPTEISLTPFTVEPIYLLYCDNGGQAQTANVTNVTFSTKVKDSLNAFSGTTFTVPKSTYYTISVHILLTAAVANAARIFEGGSVTRALTGSSASAADKSGSATIYWTAGTAVTIRMDFACTLSSSAVTHYITIQENSL